MSNNVPHPWIQVIDGYIGSYQKNNNDKKVFVKKGRVIKIKEILEDIDTEELIYYLTFNYKGKEKIIEFRREDLTKRGIQKLMKYGADVFDHYIDTMIKHLENEEAIAPKKLHHSKLGFDVYQDQEVFKHYKAINEASEYDGEYKIKPKGSLEAWQQLIRDEVIGRPALETSLAIGLSSQIVGYLKEELNSESLMVHFSGNSSVGKTTACQLAISTAGYPEVDKNSLMMSWQETHNYLMASLRDNYGLPMVFDELSTITEKDMTNYIYTLTGGKDKSRLNKDGTKKETSSWATTIMSTGEMPITKLTKRNAGLRVRLLEIKNVKLTKDAEHAERIKKGVKKNHGHASPILAEKLLEMDKEDMLKNIEKDKDKIIESFNLKDDFTPRIANKLSIILTTAEYMNDAFDFELDLDEIMNFLIEQIEAGVGDRNLAQSALEILLEELSINSSKLIKEYDLRNDSEATQVHGRSLETWGKVEKKGNFLEYSIYPTIVEKILGKHGYEAVDTILTSWRDDLKVLNADKGHKTRKRVIQPGNSRELVYAIRIKKDKTDNTSNNVTPINKIKKPRSKGGDASS